jgi:hypothetical protein
MPWIREVWGHSYLSQVKMWSSFVIRQKGGVSQGALSGKIYAKFPSSHPVSNRSCFHVD